MKKPLTQQVREAAQTFEFFNAPDLLDALDIREYAGLKRIRSVIRELRKTGEIKSVKRGVYVYAGAGTEGRKAKALDRIYRAIDVSGHFSAQDVARISRAEISYVRSVIRRLVASEDIREGGRKRNQWGKMRTVFFVVDPDQFYLEFVK